MKKVLKVVLVTLLATTLWSCGDQQPENAVTRDVQFSVRTSSSTKGNNGRTAATIPDGSELVLSIRKGSGELEIDHAHIELLRIGDGYVTSPISLKEGSYQVVDFLLVNNGEVLFAIPEVDAPLAGLVANPLPYEFSVSADALLTLEAEVIATDYASPADFGYVSFDIGTVSDESIQISAFKTDAGSLTLVEAEAYILNGLDTLDHLALEAKTNTWPFNLDPAATYTLVVGRHGSMRYSRTFNYNDLKEELDGQPLKVTLTPAVTWVSTYKGTGPGPSQGLLFFAGLYCGPDEEKFGRMYVDWGDNTAIEDILIGGKFYPSSFSHNYTQDGSYFSSTNGNLDMFLAFSIVTDVTEMDVTALNDMTTFGFGVTPSLRYLKLSRVTPIKNLGVANTNFDTAGISAVIDDLHAAVVHNNTHGGTFDYTNVATPTPAAQAQLLDLQNNYGWAITH